MNLSTVIMIIALVANIIINRKKCISRLTKLDKTINRHHFAAKRHVAKLQGRSFVQRNQFTTLQIRLYTAKNILIDLYDRIKDAILHAEIFRKRFPLTNRYFYKRKQIGSGLKIDFNKRY